MAAKSKPHKIQVTFEEVFEGEPDFIEYDLAAATDWAVIFEDVLEIKKIDGEHLYIPIDRLKGWSVKPL